MADSMSGLKRTHYAGNLRAENAGEEITVAGWVAKNRDLGNLVFTDLRDRTGIVQLAFDETTPEELISKAAALRSEFVVMAKGILRARQAVNKDIPTGEVELWVTDLRVLSKSETPPFEITPKTGVNEELRLKYRYLDLRRTEMQDTIIARHKIVKAARDYFDRNGFLEVETPMLIKSTPEGARDYLVPSRVHPGSFYALPQSPQLYKQLLMLAGYDRYMQIARCFRDEDLRADRQPEFTQIDVEMSFVDEEDVMAVNEGFVRYVFKEILNTDIPVPFKRMSYKEAMERFGSDKPDTRYGLELTDITDIAAQTDFAVFTAAAVKGSRVCAVCAPGAAEMLSRKEIDKLTSLAKTYRAKGLAYLRMTPEGETSSYEKFLTPEQAAAVRERAGVKPGDALFIVADRDQVVFDALGALRQDLARRLGLIKEGSFDFLWVTDFPLFEYDEEEGRYSAKHHPFTSPKPEHIDMLESDPANANARAYDMVLNGVEVGGGSIRISDPDVQARMFRALGFDDQTAEERFGFLLNAFKYGVPPHGGMAYGLDRLIMLMLGKDSIRDVMAFPKVQNASELMTSCPAKVDNKNLEELFIAVTKNAEEHA